MSMFGPLFTDVINDDAVTLYTQYSTQWDALSHMAHRSDADGDGISEVVFYNGFRADEDVADATIDGACGQPLGVEHMASASLQGRGLLVNIQSVYGQERSGSAMVSCRSSW